MNFHYALVDDLIPKEDFERRVEAKIDECGDLVDEPTAAMMVVGELGRAHVKIKGLSAKSSLFSFFGKVIDKTDPKVFDRADGEKGAVATLLLGDETGTVRVVLWDARAGIVREVTVGEVLEVIGRHPAKEAREIYALALRKATCQVECDLAPSAAGSLKSEPVDLDLVLLSIGQKRTYSRRDGTTGEVVDALGGDNEGTARLVAWAPAIFSKTAPGSTIHVTGAKPNTRREGREYGLDEKSTISPSQVQVSIPFVQLSSVADQGIYSVKGTIVQQKDPRPFTTRKGNSSWVRNIVISDGTDNLKIVLWGEYALLTAEKNGQIEVYHGTAKAGRYGDIELHAGRDAFVRIPGSVAETAAFTGTIIPDQGGSFIDNGTERYLLPGPDIPPFQEVTVTGTISGNTIIPEHWEQFQIPVEGLKKKIRDLRTILTVSSRQAGE